ncbi:MAG: adenosylcobinamide-GDP ribazoletransferase [Alphaproteobacteria bacterium]|nr:adenosylcobinamide-GDP ribazoletransferase [Alphaproteobacteria bacterium]
MEDTTTDHPATDHTGGAPTRRWLDELGMATTFLTRLPWPRAVPHDRPLMAAAWALPLAGLLVGVVAAAALGLGMALSLPALASAALALAAGALASGALHEDGLADLADGFGGGRDAEAKRRIMRDSRIGSYGVLALVLVTAAKLAALTALLPVSVGVTALLVAHALGRAVIPALTYWQPFAADDGLARLAGRPDIKGAAWAGGIGLGIAVVLLPAGIGLAAAVAAAGAAAVVGWLARRQIGGVTGDVLGAAEQAAEVAALLTIAAYLGP